MAGKIYETAIRIGASLSKTFGATIGGAGKSLKDLEKQAKQLKSATGGIKAFGQLEREVAAAETKARAAADELGKLRGQVKDGEKPTKALAEQIRAASKATKDAERALAKKRATLGKTGDALRKVGVDTAKLTDEQRRVEAALRKTNLRLSGMNQLAGAKVRDRLSKLVAPFKALSVVGAGAAAAVGGGLFAMAKSTADVADKAGKMAINLGMPVEALQELQYAAQRSGVETAAMDVALRTVQRTTGEAAVGAGDAVKAFGALHLSARKLAKMPLDQRMEAIAERIAAIKSPARQAALANKIFGESGVRLIGMLKGGSKGLQRLRADARATGNVLSADAAAKAAEFNDRMLDTEMALAGVKNTLGGALMPIITKTFVSLSEWVKKNRVQIQQFAQTLATWVENRAIPTVVELARRAQELAGKIYSVGSRVVELIGGFKTLGIAIGVAVGAKVIWNVVQLGKELATVAAGLGKIALSSGPAGKGISGALSAAGGSLVKFAGAAAAAGAAGYAFGTWLNDKFGISTKIADSLWNLFNAGKIAEDKKKLAQFTVSGAELRATEMAQQFAKLRASGAKSIGGPGGTRQALTASVAAGRIKAFLGKSGVSAEQSAAIMERLGGSLLSPLATLPGGGKLAPKPTLPQVRPAGAGKVDNSVKFSPTINVQGMGTSSDIEAAVKRAGDTVIERIKQAQLERRRLAYE